MKNIIKYLFGKTPTPHGDLILEEGSQRSQIKKINLTGKVPICSPPSPLGSVSKKETENPKENLRLREAAKEKEIILIVKRTSEIFGLSPSLVLAIIYQESYRANGNWHDAIYAIRQEDGFFKRYILGKKLTGYVPIKFPPSKATERHMRSVSFGLMQVMLTTAREHEFDSPYATSLLDIETNIYYGCLILRRKIDRHKDLDTGIMAYNGRPHAAATKEYLVKIKELQKELALQIETGEVK